MSKCFLVILLSLFISIICQAQQKDKFSGLTQLDRKNYILNVDQYKVGKLKDTVFGMKKYHFAYVTVKISNNSSDTLKYFGMTCSWYDVFTIDNKDAGTMGWGCDSNIPKTFKIPPHKSSMFNIPFLFPKKLDKNNFRIGLYLLKDWRQFDQFLHLSNYQDQMSSFNNYLIWSNVVSIRI